MERMRIVLADDHPIVRQGLRALLESEQQFQVVGEAADGIQAIDLVERFRPNILILDLVMPGLSGLEVMHQLHRRTPETHIVVLSMHNSKAHMLEALRQGAAGYVLKDAPGSELIQAVRDAAEGRRRLSWPLTDQEIDAYLQNSEAVAEDRYAGLTMREREVMHLVSEGFSNTEIGVRLFISPRTVEVHRANLMRKLGLRTQAELIRFTLKHDLS